VTGRSGAAALSGVPVDPVRFGILHRGVIRTAQAMSGPLSGIVNIGPRTLASASPSFLAAGGGVDQHGLAYPGELAEELALRQCQAGPGGFAPHQVRDLQGEHAGEDVDADVVLCPRTGTSPSSP